MSDTLPIYPMGPGWFIFFQNGRGGSPDDVKLDSKRIMEDDNEVIELITLLANCDVIC